MTLHVCNIGLLLHATCKSWKSLLAILWLWMLSFCIWSGLPNSFGLIIPCACARGKAISSVCLSITGRKKKIPNLMVLAPFMTSKQTSNFGNNTKFSVPDNRLTSFNSLCFQLYLISLSIHLWPGIIHTHTHQLATCFFSHIP